MKLFHVIDDAQVILRSRGVYKQAKLYRRGDEIFAGANGGFIRMMGSHGTSVPSVSWLDIYGVKLEDNAGVGGLKLRHR